MAGTVTSSGGGAARLAGLAREEPMRVNAPGTGMLKMVSRPERQVSTFQVRVRVRVRVRLGLGLGLGLPQP